MKRSHRLLIRVVYSQLSSHRENIEEPIMNFTNETERNKSVQGDDDLRRTNSNQCSMSGDNRMNLPDETKKRIQTKLCLVVNAATSESPYSSDSDALEMLPTESTDATDFNPNQNQVWIAEPSRLDGSVPLPAECHTSTSIPITETMATTIEYNYSHPNDACAASVKPSLLCQMYDRPKFVPVVPDDQQDVSPFYSASKIGSSSSRRTVKQPPPITLADSSSSENIPDPEAQFPPPGHSKYKMHTTNDTSSSIATNEEELYRENPTNGFDCCLNVFCGIRRSQTGRHFSTSTFARLLCLGTTILIIFFWIITLTLYKGENDLDGR